MRLLTNIILIALMLPTFISCQSEYTTQHFSFPPGSRPHENDWKYTALIIVSSSESPITKRSKKRVQIKVYDKSKANLLNESFEFISSSIDANVEWEKFEDIKVELLEVGNEYAKDQYNKKLLKSAPNSLIKLKYKYDQGSEKFKKID